MSEPTLSNREPLLSGEPFKQLITILISLTSILLALINWLQADAADRATLFARDASRYAIQAMGRQASGEAQASYAYSDAFRQWYGANALSWQAQKRGDEAAARRYAALRDGLVRLSPLLSAPYFKSGGPDIAAFEADVYLVEAALLNEQFANANQLGQVWLAKSTTYRTHLILLATAIFLYALATTLHERIHWLFVSVGLLMVIAVAGWMLVVLLTPIPSSPEAAMTAYSRGIGLAHQGLHQQAIQEFGQALSQSPDYANALYRRGNAFYDIQEYNKAAADYEAAIRAGRADAHVYWNLGWTYYVLGQFDRAISATQQAIQADPDQVALYFNLGLMRLAQGQLHAAQSVYAQGIEMAARQVTQARAANQEPPTSLWWYLDTAAADLSNLLTCMDGQVCHESPSFATIVFPPPDQGELQGALAGYIPPYLPLQAPDSVQVAESLLWRLKNLAVGLEYTGHKPGDWTASVIGPLQIAQAVYDEQGQLASYAPLSAQAPLRFGRVQEQEGQFADVSISRLQQGADNLFLLFDYRNMENGQMVVVKTYRDDEQIGFDEMLELRLVQEWTLGRAGQAAWPLIPDSTWSLSPGKYRVELYVNSLLAQRTGFEIQAQ